MLLCAAAPVVNCQQSIRNSTTPKSDYVGFVRNTYREGWSLDTQAPRGIPSSTQVDYADKVTEEGWKSSGARLNRASDILAQAMKLPTKCPHSYFLMLEIARTQGWPKAKARDLFESAIAFEPSYYHYYREFANKLRTKWSGAPGEADASAEESARRLGGREGAFVYFELASLIYCPCGGEQPARPQLSWPKIQQGFAVLAADYGVTNLKLNRYTALAYLYQDSGVNL